MNIYQEPDSPNSGYKLIFVIDHGSHATWWAGYRYETLTNPIHFRTTYNYIGEFK